IAMAAKRVSWRAGGAVGGGRLSSGRARRGAALGPHGPAPSAVGRRRALDLARRAGVAAAPWPAAGLCLEWAGPGAPMAARSGARPGSCSTGGLLERGDGRVHRLAHASDVRAGAPLRGVARIRARELSRERSPVLVAGGSAVAQYSDLAAVDGSAVPVPRHASMRRAVGLPRVFRSAGV